MDLILKILLYSIKLYCLHIFLCAVTTGSRLFNHGNAVIDNGDVIYVNVTEIKPKLCSIYLQREKRLVNRYGKLNNELSSETFTCTENNGQFSCMNGDDTNSIFVENCSNMSRVNKKNAAHIIAVIYRKVEDAKKDELTSFYLKGPPTLPPEMPSTNDLFHPCHQATCSQNPTTLGSQACGHITVKVVHPVTKCLPYECNNNSTEYLCMSQLFNEPQRIMIPETNENYSGNFSFKFAMNNQVRKRRRNVRHLKSVKTKHKMKKKSSHCKYFSVKSTCKY